MSLTPGVRLGAYEVIALIGAGGMGEVYRARDIRLGRDIAIKVLPAGVAGDSERLHRFKREARAAAALNHPNIVTIHSVEQVGDAHFITMELVEGRTLAAVVPKHGLPLDQILTVAVPLADAISTASSAASSSTDGVLSTWRFLDLPTHLRERERASALLAELDTLEQAGRDVATWILHVYAGRADADQVIRCLEHAVDRRSSSTLYRDASVRRFRQAGSALHYDPPPYGSGTPGDISPDAGVEAPSPIRSCRELRPVLRLLFQKNFVALSIHACISWS